MPTLTRPQTIWIESTGPPSYAWVVDMTVLTALSSITVEQTKASNWMLGRCMQLLGYLTSNNIAKVRFHVSEMIMNIHSDASYLLAPGARSQTCGHFFMGWTPKDNEPIKLNRAFHTNTTIMWYVVALAAETELGALFHNCQTAIVFLTNLSQPWTPTT